MPIRLIHFLVLDTLLEPFNHPTVVYMSVSLYLFFC